MSFLCFRGSVSKPPLREPNEFQKLQEEGLVKTEEPLLAVRQIPGKGNGLVALGFIRQGQQIVEELPVCQRPSLPQQPSKLQRQASLGCGIPSALWDSAASDVLSGFARGPPLAGHRVAPVQQVKMTGGLPCASFYEVVIDAHTEEVGPPASPMTATASLLTASSVSTPQAAIGQADGEAGTSGPAVQMESPARCSRGPGSKSSLFPLISSINHSCLPNVHASWNQVQKKEVVYALKDIHPGEEVVASYVPLDMDSADRQEQLLTRFGFSCDCAACCAPKDVLQKSDKRRRRMAELDYMIPVLAQKKPWMALNCVQELVKLVDREGIADTSLKARAYYDAFQICLSYPQVGDAKHYARLAFENYLICRGPDSPCTLRQHAYMLNPESHPASKTAKHYADAVRQRIENERTRDAISLPKGSGGENKESKRAGKSLAAQFGSRLKSRLLTTQSLLGSFGDADLKASDKARAKQTWQGSSLLDSHLGSVHAEFSSCSNPLFRPTSEEAKQRAELYLPLPAVDQRQHLNQPSSQGLAEVSSAAEPELQRSSEPTMQAKELQIAEVEQPEDGIAEVSRLSSGSLQLLYDAEEKAEVSGSHAQATRAPW